MIPSWLQAVTSALPASVSPGPVSGDDGKVERDAMAEQVRPRPDQPERAQPGRVPGIERIEIGVDRLRALDVDLDREGAVRHRPLDVGNGPDDANRTLASRSSRSSRPSEVSANSCAWPVDIIGGMVSMLR